LHIRRSAIEAQSDHQWFGNSANWTALKTHTKIESRDEFVSISNNRKQRRHCSQATRTNDQEHFGFMLQPSCRQLDVCCLVPSQNLRRTVSTKTNWWQQAWRHVVNTARILGSFQKNKTSSRS
jgi:hypothetical protein